jgi:hypothetical protein
MAGRNINANATRIAEKALFIGFSPLGVAGH